MIEFFRQALAIVFYILFFTWIFFKLRTIYLVYKLKCKEAYREVKSSIKNNKKPNLYKYAKTFIIVIIVLTALYIASIIFSYAIIVFILIITGFGVALETEGLTWLKCILGFFYLYADTIKYGLYIITVIVYLIFYTLLIMNMYVDYISYKELKKINKKDANLT